MRDVDYEVVITTSGAPAMYDRTAGEVMHPVAGPLAEAEQLYVLPSRLSEISTSTMTVARYGSAAQNSDGSTRNALLDFA